MPQFRDRLEFGEPDLAGADRNLAPVGANRFRQHGVAYGTEQGGVERSGWGVAASTSSAPREAAESAAAECLRKARRSCVMSRSPHRAMGEVR